MRHPRFAFVLSLAIALAAAFASSAQAQPDYTLFESDPVRPIALSPDGQRVFLVDRPGGRLEIFDLSTGFAVPQASVPVGLEPVAVAARNNDEVWVVNHMSDSVSVVDVSVTPPRVVRTLLVGDEPRDIVFAGPGGNRSFITTAHRGQNSPYPDGQYDLPGIGRADVWVFNATALGTSLGGDPLTILTLFGDRPRALATSPDGSKVYAAVFRSGNQTVAVGEDLVCNVNQSQPCTIAGTSYPGRRPQPWTNIDGILSRETGIIVGFDQASGQWRDELDRNWNNAVPFNIPDLDVFEIDANGPVPTELGSVAGVGTILFNMIVNPANGNVYVTNTDANNRVRFEGFGDYAAPGELGPKPSGDPATVRGNLHKSRITVLEASGDNLGTPETEFSVIARHLNKHIDYAARPTPVDVKYRSVATPLGMAISDDGSTLYVAAFGSDAVAVYDTAELENDTFVPSTLISIFERPAGLVLDDANDRLYVATQNALHVVDTNANVVIESRFVFDPESFNVRVGRKFLYSALATSSNGEASCSSCHVFGDMDDLSWDLGDPDGSPAANPNPAPPLVDFPPINDLKPFDPLKGPMTTQSLRGMAFAGPMHWRGDRTGGASGGDPMDEAAAFTAFNVAFPGLVGRDEGELAAADMNVFTNFILQLNYPPNPIRALDNSLTVEQQAGLDLYNGRITDTVANCNGCHVLDRTQGFFGTGGGSTFEAEAQEFKVPHLRNAYQKVGMFGRMPSSFFPDAPGVFMDDQVRATGFLHDGSVATVADFLGAGAFSTVVDEEQDLEALIMAFETDMAPIVGQQATLTNTSLGDVDSRITLLIDRAEANFVLPGNINTKECDLIVKGVVDGVQRGWVYLGGDEFDPDVAAEPTWSRAELEAVASVPGQALTFTCVPPGSGVRMGINRDRDAALDGDDSNPAAPPASACRVAPATPASNGFAALFLILMGLASRFMVAGRRRR